MNLSEFTEEIVNSLSLYESDIDRVGIKTNVINQLKILGNDGCELIETVLEIENSRVKLPENFKSLKLALNLTPQSCDTKGKPHLVTDNYIYKQWIENPAYFDEINLEYVTTCKSKIITQTITVSGHDVDFHYNWSWLKLTKGINRESISGDCLNINPRLRFTCKDEINITRNYLNTNFSEGRIYLQYYGYPVDEDGEIIIPEISTGDIYRYLELYCKIKITEELIANNKNAQGLSQLYSVWISKEREFKRAAIVEAKFGSLSKDWYKKLKRINQRDFIKYSLPSLKF